jgi:acyl-CoA thioester hydrolase
VLQLSGATARSGGSGSLAHAPVAQLLEKRFQMQLPLRVAWGDMDAMSHVNNCVIVKYIEHGRVSYMEGLGVAVAREGSDKFPSEAEVEPSLILAGVSCRFRRPINYPDTIVIGTRLTSARPERGDFILEHALWSIDQQTIVATGTSDCVVYDYLKGKRAPLPERWARMFLQLDGITELPKS